MPTLPKARPQAAPLTVLPAPTPARDVLPLAMVDDGGCVEILRVETACPRLRKRLADLGLNPGMRVRVIQARTTGPMILAVAHDARVAVGRGMAHKISVRRVPTEF